MNDWDNKYSIYKTLEEKCIKWEIDSPKYGESWDTSLDKILMLIELLEEKLGDALSDKIHGQIKAMNCKDCPLGRN